MSYFDPVENVCYLGHIDCWDRHEPERLADEADWETDREQSELEHIQRSIIEWGPAQIVRAWD